MIDLPLYPSPNGAEVGLIDFGATLTPSLGGPVQRVNRTGARFRIMVTLPPMNVADGRKWIARLVRGKFEGARMPYPLLGFNPGSPGEVRINGVGQAGSMLIVDGATPNYVFREGQPFSIETAGKHHLYLIAAETIADSTGHASLPITPMLRRPHGDNDLCYFGKPMIEGFIDGDEMSWNLNINHHVGFQYGLSESQ